MSQRHRGVDWRNAPVGAVAAGDEFYFCDLRDTRFDRLDLSHTTFVGCRLNGTSFTESDLGEARFIGCFSAVQDAPTDVRRSRWEGTVVLHSHLNLSTEGDSGPWRWPDSEAAAAWQALSGDNTARYQAIETLVELNNPVTVPFVATFLNDPQWDVRSIALRSLDAFRAGQFEADDEALLEWMWFRLGDEHPIVRNTAGDLVRRYVPTERSVQPAVNQMRESSTDRQRQGLLVAAKLLEINRAYGRLIDRQVLRSLAESADDEVRIQSLYVIGMLDDQNLYSSVLNSFTHPAPAVRKSAVCAVTLFSSEPPTARLVPLLSDSDKEVRVEALAALRHVKDLSAKDLETALSDPAPDVRQFARSILKKADKE